MDWRAPRYPAFPTEEHCPPEFEHIKGSELPVPERYAWIVDPQEQAAIVELDARRRAWLAACNKIHAQVVVPGWQAWKDDPQRERTAAERAGFADFMSPPKAPSIWEECNKIRKLEREAAAKREAARQQREQKAIERAGARDATTAEGEGGATSAAFAVREERQGVVWRQKLIDAERDALKQRDLAAELQELPEWVVQRLLELNDNQLTFLYFLCTNPLVGPWQELTRTRDNPRGNVSLWGYGNFTRRSASNGGIPTAWKKWLLTPEGRELFAPIRTLSSSLEVLPAEPAPEGLEPSFATAAVTLLPGIYSFCHWGEEPRLSGKKDAVTQGRILVFPQMARLLKQELDRCFNIVRLHHQPLLKAVLAHPGYKPQNEDVVHWFFYDWLAIEKAPSGPAPQQWMADYQRLPGILRPPFAVAQGLHELPSLAQISGWDRVELAGLPRGDDGRVSEDTVQQAAWQEFMDSHCGTTTQEEDQVWRSRQHWPSKEPGAAELAMAKRGNGWLMGQLANDQAWEQGHRLNFKLPKRPG